MLSQALGEPPESFPDQPSAGFVSVADVCPYR
jgi:hypothetical protein